MEILDDIQEPTSLLEDTDALTSMQVNKGRFF